MLILQLPAPDRFYHQAGAIRNLSRRVLHSRRSHPSSLPCDPFADAGAAGGDATATVADKMPNHKTSHTAHLNRFSLLFGRRAG